MKLRAFPLLQGEKAEEFVVDDLTPRLFANLLDSHKALVLRAPLSEKSPGKVWNVEDFGCFLVGLDLEYYPYIGGAAPRTVIPVEAAKDIIFTANESPPSEPIPMHHELAQTPNPPQYIFFYCESPPDSGGETPLIDSTLVYRFVQDNFPDFLQKLKEHGVRYIRTMPVEDDPNSPIGRSYKNTWSVSSPEELEAKLSQKEGCSWEWLTDGSVRITSEPVPALRFVSTSPGNDTPIYQWTFANSLVAAFLGWQDVRNDRHEALRFGNFDLLPEDVLEEIAKFMDQNRVLHKWQSGDVFAIQNQLVMHSRNPFEGKRRILASIWGKPKQAAYHDGLAELPNGVSLGPRLALKPLENPPDPLIFGFWKVSRESAADVAYAAIQAGYRRLDCACDYGNEAEVGVGIKRALEDGLCKRKELFITSKLWNTYHHPDHVPLALQRTLQDLMLEYVDEYLIHFPISMEYVPIEVKYPPEWANAEGKMVLVAQDIGETWKAMEDLVEAGKTKTIGVCNFSSQLLRQLVASSRRFRPATLQIEIHPHNTQSKLIRLARDQLGLRVTGFSVLGATSYLILNDTLKESDVLLLDSTIAGIAKQYKKSPAQILIRWALQRNTLPISKTSSLERMKENRNVFDFFLTMKDMEKIDALNRNRRYNDPGDFCEPGMGTFCPIYE